MTVQKNKRGTIKIQNPQIILKVFCYTPISKPLNGSMPRSNTSHFLRLAPIEYTYTHGKETKTASSEIYLIKGLRGAIRHQVSRTSSDYGLEVCHSTDKEFDKHGNSLLPSGFHLLGSCRNNGECIVHQIFGSKTNEGLISVSADPITSISQKSAQTTIKIQKVHIATENRICKTADGKSVQNFGERYFSGQFSFEIDISKCDPSQMGLILNL